ncbi:hypothetical protein [Limisalsivibrio acetivorans]|uniref:hypothetical protein n=1 Tax=Limisalsivibrio acetivorans TaxID=1304888 RepID=UPI0003B589EB|nr:hypothetical protein [Limisalsivibrio acetivorans]
MIRPALLLTAVFFFFSTALEVHSVMPPSHYRKTAQKSPLKALVRVVEVKTLSRGKYANLKEAVVDVLDPLEGSIGESRIWVRFHNVPPGKEPLEGGQIYFDLKEGTRGFITADSGYVTTWTPYSRQLGSVVASEPWRLDYRMGSAVVLPHPCSDKKLTDLAREVAGKDYDYASYSCEGIGAELDGEMWRDVIVYFDFHMNEGLDPVTVAFVMIKGEHGFLKAGKWIFRGKNAGLRFLTEDIAGGPEDELIVEGDISGNQSSESYLEIWMRFGKGYSNVLEAPLSVHYGGFPYSFEANWKASGKNLIIYNITVSDGREGEWVEKTRTLMFWWRGRDFEPDEPIEPFMKPLNDYKEGS